MALVGTALAFLIPLDSGDSTPWGRRGWHNAIVDQWVESVQTILKPVLTIINS